MRKSDGSVYTEADFENALRGANNNQLGETIQTGMIVPINAQTPTSAIYDSTGMLLTNDGKGNNSLVQNPAMLQTPSTDLMSFIQANGGSMYTWSNAATPGAVQQPSVSPFAPGWNTGEASAGLDPLALGLQVPDYLSVNGSLYAASINFAMNLRNGQIYFGAGASIPGASGGSITTGFIPSNYVYGLSNIQKTNNTDSFLGGIAVGGNACLYAICFSLNHAIGGETAKEVGIGFGGISKWN